METLDTSPESRLSRLARFWAHHDAPLTARTVWTERIEELIAQDQPDTIIREWMNRLSQPGQMKTHFLILENDPSVDVDFVGEGLREVYETRWKTPAGGDRLSGTFVHQHGSDHRNDVF